MFAIFLGERMIGAGGEPHGGDGRRPGAGDRRDGGALRARRRRRHRSPQARAHAAGAVRGRAGGRAAVRDPVGSAGRSAFKQPLERNWPKLSTVLSALWPVVWVAAAWPILLVELAYARDGARAAPGAGTHPRAPMLSGLRPGRRADRRVLVRLRRVRARQEARPRVLPHLAPGRGDPPDRRATWISRSRSPCSSRRPTRCATRWTTT